MSIQRYKGLGEMNPEQLWETTMDPEKNTITGYCKSAAEAAETFQDLMGSDVEARRSFIERNAKFVVNLDIKLGYKMVDFNRDNTFREILLMK